MRAARCALRFLPRHARTNIFLDQQDEMGMNFAVEVCVDAAREKEIAQEAA
jgi:hypothetical protein